VSRSDGFAVMDVSTDIANDPKFRKLHRHAPDHSAAAFVGYISTLAESWKAGKRVSIDDSWPAFLPFDQTSVEALVAVGLLDNRGMIPSKAWHGWFDPALKRRENSRDRWRRANDKRRDDSTNDHGHTAFVPRGSSADTVAIPSVPSVRTVPSVNGAAPRRPNTIDKDPHLREYREAIREIHGPGMDEPPPGWKVKP
jgi:hypothetical protein